MKTTAVCPLGQRIRRIYKEHKLLQEELAERAGIREIARTTHMSV